MYQTVCACPLLIYVLTTVVFDSYLRQSIDVKWTTFLFALKGNVESMCVNFHSIYCFISLPLLPFKSGNRIQPPLRRLLHYPSHDVKTKQSGDITSANKAKVQQNSRRFCCSLIKVRVSFNIASSETYYMISTIQTMFLC